MSEYEETSQELEGGLTEAQRTFCQSYLKDFSVKKAVSEVKKNFPKENPNRYLHSAKVLKYLEVRRNEICKTFVTEHDLLSKTLECLERCIEKVPVIDSKGHPTSATTFDSKGAYNFLKLLYDYKKMFGSEKGEEAIDRFRNIQTSKNDLKEFKDFFDKEY